MSNLLESYGLLSETDNKQVYLKVSVCRYRDHGDAVCLGILPGKHHIQVLNWLSLAKST